MAEFLGMLPTGWHDIEGCPSGLLAGLLAAWLAGWLAGWLFGWLAGCLGGWLAGGVVAGWLVGWLVVCCLAGCLCGCWLIVWWWGFGLTGCRFLFYVCPLPWDLGPLSVRLFVWCLSDCPFFCLSACLLVARLSAPSVACLSFCG